MKKILIANIFGIGDVLNTTPLITNLKKTYENVSIDYLCNGRVFDIAGDIPGIDSIFVYEKDDFVRLWKSSKRKWFTALFGLFRDIKKQKYDAVFDFTLSREFGLFFALSGIRSRIGFDYKGRGIFLTKKVPLTAFEKRHVIEYDLDLLKTSGIPSLEKKMSLEADAESIAQISGYFEKMGIDSERLVTIVPGGGASWGKQAYRRRWDAENFSLVADSLSEKGFQIAIVGDNSEKELCNKVSGGMKHAPSAVRNDLSIKQYVAFLKKSRLVVCNDGGPLHITVALGTKGVFVFGPVDEKVYGPYPVTERHKPILSYDVECRPCYHKFKLPECTREKECLRKITPEQVLSVSLKLLEKD
ncbi:MAG: glycosyltransferase family 9 protein [Candidatus Omnitrophica bacterium]|nr:glycosyltransferase family 9 protein [Candidatus Omnitrophota bacterium]